MEVPKRPFSHNPRFPLLTSFYPKINPVYVLQATAAGIIIDEAYMLDSRYYHALDTFLRRMAADSRDQAVQALQHLPFGGKVLVLIGDMQQLPPVCKTFTQMVERSFKATDFWSGVIHERLKISERLKGDPEFAEYLEKIATDAKDLDRTGDGKLCLPSYLKHETDEDNAIEWLFGDDLRELEQRRFNIHDPRSRAAALGLSKCAYLCSVNMRGRQVNRALTERMAGETQTLTSDNTVLCDGESFSVGHFSSADFLEEIHDGSSAPGQLYLKPGSVVFIMVNLSPSLPKYTKCVVLETSSTRGSVKLLRMRDLEESVKWDKGETDEKTGKRKGRALDLVRDSFSVPRMVKEIKHQHLTVRRTQFPLAPALAYTVHKCQGQTLDRVCFDVKNGEIFSHGMLYVGCSRVRHSRHLRFFAGSEDLTEDGRVIVGNVVLQSLIQKEQINLGLFSREMREAAALDKRGRDQYKRWQDRDLREAAPDGVRTERKWYNPKAPGNVLDQVTEDPEEAAFSARGLAGCLGELAADVARTMAGQKIDPDRYAGEILERLHYEAQDVSDMEDVWYDRRYGDFRDDDEDEGEDAWLAAMEADHYDKTSGDYVIDAGGGGAASSSAEPTKNGPKLGRLGRAEIDELERDLQPEEEDVDPDERLDLGYRYRSTRRRRDGKSLSLMECKALCSRAKRSRAQDKDACRKHGKLGAEHGKLGAEHGKLGKGSWNAKGALGGAFGEKGGGFGIFGPKAKERARRG